MLRYSKTTHTHSLSFQSINLYWDEMRKEFDSIDIFGVIVCRERWLNWIFFASMWAAPWENMLMIQHGSILLPLVPLVFKRLLNSSRTIPFFSFHLI
jgi:hypothetical protein